MARVASTGHDGMVLKSIADGKETRIDLPTNADPGLFRWWPDGKRFVLTSARDRNRALDRGQRHRPAAPVGHEDQRGVRRGHAVAARQRDVARANGRRGPRACARRADGARRAGRPRELRQGHAGADVSGPAREPARRAAARLLRHLSAGSGRRRRRKADAAGQARHIRARYGHHPMATTSWSSPFSAPIRTCTSSSDFPTEVEVWDRGGRTVHKLASLPLADQVPIEGVADRTTRLFVASDRRRDLVWVEALDGGDPSKAATHRNGREDAQGAVQRAADRADEDGASLRPAGNGGKRMAWSSSETTIESAAGAGPSCSTPTSRHRRQGGLEPLGQDLYEADPGNPVHEGAAHAEVRHASGRRRDFLDGTRRDTARGPSVSRPLQPEDLEGRAGLPQRRGELRELVALLADDGSRFLTSYETQTAPPNYVVRTAHGGSKGAVTRLADPDAAIAGHQEGTGPYKRKDGVDLSFTLYLPPGLPGGTPLPTILCGHSDRVQRLRASPARCRGRPIVSRARRALAPVLGPDGICGPATARRCP